jgi:hypothetical protein
VPASTVQSWLLSIADFTSESHNARLVYSHPLGATIYIPALQAWMKHAKELARQGGFRWYTMGAMADFLNQRSAVQWTLVSHPGEKQLLEASHPKGLEHQAWMFSKTQYRQPRATHGAATIRSADNWWIVTADNCKQLTIELDEQQL